MSKTAEETKYHRSSPFTILAVLDIEGQRLKSMSGEFLLCNTQLCAPRATKPSCEPHEESCKWCRLAGYQQGIETGRASHAKSSRLQSFPMPQGTKYILISTSEVHLTCDALKSWGATVALSDKPATPTLRSPIFPSGYYYQMRNPQNKRLLSEWLS